MRKHKGIISVVNKKLITSCSSVFTRAPKENMDKQKYQLLGFPIKMNFVLFIQASCGTEITQNTNCSLYIRTSAVPMFVFLKKGGRREAQIDCYQSALKDQEPSLVHHRVCNSVAI